MTFSEMVSFSKLFAVAMGSGDMSMNQAEFDSACETLKTFADERNDWNQAQKEAYKMMVDYAKAKTEGRING